MAGNRRPKQPDVPPDPAPTAEESPAPADVSVLGFPHVLIFLTPSPTREGYLDVNVHAGGGLTHPPAIAEVMRRGHAQYCNDVAMDMAMHPPIFDAGGNMVGRA